MKVIAFDLGSTMAMAMSADNGIFTVTETFAGCREHRAAATLSWLHKVLAMGKHCEAVIYERPFARGQNATRSLWGLAGLIEATATLHGFPVLDIVPATIKKWATGAGNASKDDMILMAQLAGYAGDNEHEADAYNLCRYAMENIRDPKATG